MLRNENLPDNPGCYLFKDKKDKVIYIGKAKNLKKRLKSYIQKNDNIKNANIIKFAESVDFIATDNEFEALILENTLIKKYQPKYNIRLKDAKSHTYIKLTDEKFPRFIIARNKISKGKFYGPFISANERDYILRFLTKTFALRTCKKFPKKPCLRYHMKVCAAPCLNLINYKEYEKRIQKAKMILNGKTNQLKLKMKKEVENYSSQKKFENAAIIRDQLNAINNLSERQKIERQKKYNEDIINFEIRDYNVYLMLFNIYKGTLTNKNEFVFRFNEDFLEEFVIQYYSDNPIPNEIIIPISLSSFSRKFLEKQKKSKVKVTIPIRGEKKHLLDLVKRNIEISFFDGYDKIISLKSKLKLEELPRIIECFDISHLSGTSTVGSMVQFRNGKPSKSNYRRFKIRTVEGIDDFSAISEIVRRRYSRLQIEKSDLPNLIIIDGGRGQLNYALKEIKMLGLDLPIISIAKQYEEIFTPDKIRPLRLPANDKALRFTQEIRDEAHRFALNYNRNLRKKVMIS